MPQLRGDYAMSPDPRRVVETFVGAYNGLDFDGMRVCLSESVRFAHYNRGFAFQTADDLIAALRMFASNYLPDRQLGPALRTAVVNSTVYREQLWTGNLTADLPGFGSKGTAFSQRLCSVFTIGPDATIVEYLDYG